jgi:TIR domain
MSDQMSDVFISHVEEDKLPALQIALRLEERGFASWTYELDRLGGQSYLTVTGTAIENCRGVILIISRDSLSSHQVTREVERAHECAKPFIPVLRGVAHVEFQNRQPVWREALGTTTSLELVEPLHIEELIADIIRSSVH